MSAELAGVRSTELKQVGLTLVEKSGIQSTTL
jgi:hypothetical protein